MTVKSLNPTSKKAIAIAFSENNVPINDLARYYNRSRRTIIRVLEEQNVEPGVKKRGPRRKATTIEQPAPRPTFSARVKRWYDNLFNRKYGKEEERSAHAA